MSVAEQLREEGGKKALMDTAKNFLSDGLDPAIVAKNTGLDLETVKKLKSTLH